MPIIVINGLHTHSQVVKMKDDIWRVVDSFMPEIKKDITIDVVHSTAHDGNDNDRPYISVMHDDTCGEEIARIISEELNVQTVWVHINRFFKGKA